ncbi:hypothetical protein KAI87_13670 [Myxococcota bacterium]|nr:hypothetical protein [Myxococcota bacterium]
MSNSEKDQPQDSGNTAANNAEPSDKEPKKKKKGFAINKGAALDNPREKLWGKDSANYGYKGLPVDQNPKKSKYPPKKKKEGWRLRRALRD